MRRRKRRHLRPSVRFAVLRRDGFTCQYCGAKAPDVVLHVDHRIPVHRGGTNDVDNLVTSCQACNLGKHISEDAEHEPRLSNALAALDRFELTLRDLGLSAAEADRVVVAAFGERSVARLLVIATDHFYGPETEIGDSDGPMSSSGSKEDSLQ